MLKVKLSIKFYIISMVLFLLVVFGWYSLYFINTNEILTEDNLPLGTDEKLAISVLITLVLASWTVSLLVMIRHIFKGCAYYMDNEGIHNTLSATIVLAFIFVVPVKEIPYSAIDRIAQDDGVVVLHLDKSKIAAPKILKPFMRKEHRMFLGFSKQTPEEIKESLRKFSSVEF